MNKKAFGILVLVFFIFMFSLRVISSSFAKMHTKPPKNDALVETLEEKRFNAFKRVLSASTYFVNSSVELDSNKIKAVVDGKYVVYIKSGTYMMRIDDVTQEREYCKIVDAVEQSFGEEPGNSILTCMETLNGSIEIGGISAEIYDTYKVLSVKSDEKSLLYDISKSHANGELISVDEINYNIKISNYLLTSMDAKYNDTEDIFGICGHIYNHDKLEDTFVFSTYDENKQLIGQMDFKYENSTKKFLPFCVEEKLDKDIVKYYSIERIGE